MKKIALIALLLIAGSALAFFALRPRTPQNIILITVDTLRADHMSLYGYRRATSPEIDRRALTAEVYERVFVQWPKTVPSMVSMFSSTYPHTNGVLFGSRGQYIEDDLVMLPEILQEHGFKTYGIVSNAVMADATNFSQGFDQYVETWMDRRRGERHSTADHVTDLALKALDDFRGNNFLWLHYVDPHYQYSPPPPYDRMYVNDKFYRKRRVLKMNPEDSNYYGGVAARIFALDQTLEWDFYVAQYDAEIRFLDDQLKRLFKKFDDNGLWKNSVVVFTSDHGESLGENRYFFEHGWFPYTASSHIPLVIWDPQTQHKRISASIQIMDLVPEILKRFKLPAGDQMEGRPFDLQNPRPVYIESGEGQLNRFNYIRSIWSWPYHLVYVPSELYQNMMQNQPFELYNVENDWYEAKNIINLEPEVAKKLEKQLLQWIQSAPNYKPVNKKTPDYDPEAIEHMEALGYIN